MFLWDKTPIPISLTNYDQNGSVDYTDKATQVSHSESLKLCNANCSDFSVFCSFHLLLAVLSALSFSPTISISERSAFSINLNVSDSLRIIAYSPITVNLLAR